MRSVFSFISLLLLSLLAYNTFTTRFPVPAEIPPETGSLLPEYVAGETKTVVPFPQSSSEPSAASHRSLKEESSSTRPPNARFRISHKDQNLVMQKKRVAFSSPKSRRHQKRALDILRSSEVVSKNFESRVTEFLGPNSSCEPRFFMTWISSIDSFGSREILSVESLFRAHPRGCLVVVSRSMDSTKGARILRPFAEKGHKVAAISPDFNYLFGKTAAMAWYNRLKHGTIKPGRISLGQNLSNLLRLVVLYKFGGIYLDTDMIIVNSFGHLKNTIGAQNIDPKTRKWSRLNNAAMIFDKGHPLLLDFIEEFANTFDGNKWGHNGPYLVSRVAARGRRGVGYDLTVLGPGAFYPVGWRKIGGFFEGPRNASHSRWMDGKVRQIRRQSLAVHLWNKQSKGLEVEKGSIIEQLMMGL